MLKKISRLLIPASSINRQWRFNYRWLLLY